MRRWLAPGAVLLGLLLLWEAIVRAKVVDPLLLPAPTSVAQSLWEDRSLLAPDLLVTTGEVVLGLLASVALGVGLAVAMHLIPAVERALRPLVVGSQAVPIPVIAPLIVFMLGFGLAPKILIVALICFFPVVVNVADGLRDSDPEARRGLPPLPASRRERAGFLAAPAAPPAGGPGGEKGAPGGGLRG